MRREPTKSPSARYVCDHAFFDCVETEEQAYWLGFLMADGCVCRSVVHLGLAVRDHSHVERFRQALQSAHPITTYIQKWGVKPGSTASRIQIRSVQMTEALARYGVGPRKTWTAEWTDRLPSDLYRHYLRGAFDGDGCWSVSSTQDGRRRAVRSVFWKLCGSVPYLTGCQSYLMNTVGFHETKFTRDGHISELVYAGRKQLLVLWHHLYDGATIYLDRKRQVPIAALEQTALEPWQRLRMSPDREAEAVAAYVAGQSTIGIAREMGSSRYRIAQAVSRAGHKLRSFSEGMILSRRNHPNWGQ